jgi:protease I
MQRALIVIAPSGYQDVEYAGTRKGLEDAGFAITIASTQAGPCRGKFGGEVTADVALKDAKAEGFDRVAFIGGPGARALADDPEAVRLAKEAEACPAFGAICIAPLILAKAGVLRGKRATVWNEDGRQESLLRAAGADYTGEAVTVDGTLVTANGPEAAEEFGRVLASRMKNDK